MTDPVQRLREALNVWFMPSWSDVEVNVLDAARALLDALPDLLQAAKAEGWDEGYDDDRSDGYYETQEAVNPYRVAAADELARETRGRRDTNDVRMRRVRT